MNSLTITAHAVVSADLHGKARALSLNHDIALSATAGIAVAFEVARDDMPPRYADARFPRVAPCRAFYGLWALSHLASTGVVAYFWVRGSS
jgi:hypothetical protein